MVRFWRYIRVTFFSLAVFVAPLMANDFWLSPEETSCIGIGDGLAGLLGGGGGGIATKTHCGFRVPSGPDDIFQCYAPDSSGTCRLNGRFASISELPAAAKLEPVANDISCYRYKKELYIVVETAIPEQVYDTVLHYPTPTRCYKDSTSCQKDQITPDSVHRYQKTFYSCKNSETTREGCPITDKGISLVFNQKGELTQWNLEALQLYLSLKDENNVSRFMNKTEQERKRRFDYTITYPWKYSSKDAKKLADATVRKSKGMQFYSGLKKSERKDSQFATMYDVINACKEWEAK